MHSRVSTLIFTAGAALTFTVGTVPAAAADTTQSVLGRGTIVRLRLDTDLKAGDSKPGDPVRFTVDRDIYGPNHVLLLKKGMAATGKVTVSTAYDRFGRRGRLTFVGTAVQTDGGVSVPINLVVGSGSGAAADAADEMDAQEYYFFNLDPLPTDGYVQSGTPGYYTQRSGLTVSTIYDPGRQFEGGPEVTAKRGDKFTAKVAADTPVPVLPQY